MNKSSTKKTARKSAKTARPSWPKGALKRGFVSNADLPLYREFVAEVKKQAKRQRDREAKQAKRAARIAQMAANVSGTAQHDAIQGWGSTSTARMTESKTYPWHAAFTVSGLTDDALKRVLSRVGSLRRKPTKHGDGTYSVTITPWLDFATPKEAFEVGSDGKTMLERSAHTEMQKLRADGAAKVEYHGAFYNKFFEGGE